MNSDNIAQYINDVGALVEKWTPLPLAGEDTLNGLIEEMFTSNTDALLSALIASGVKAGVPDSHANPRISTIRVGRWWVEVHRDTLEWDVGGEGEVNKSKVMDDISATPSFAASLTSFISLSANGDVDLVSYIEAKTAFIVALFNAARPILEAVEAATEEG